MSFDQKEKISIILPAYNSEKYIDKCIESVFRQEEKHFELIIINDGSTDGTYEICQKWKNKDKRIILINQENMGQGSARNEGIKVATGSYLIFVDSDDYLEPGALKLLYPYIYSDKDIIMYNYYLKPNDSLEKYKFEISINFSSKSEILIDSTTYLWDKMFKRTFFAENMELKNFYGEDLAACAYLIAITDKIDLLSEAIYTHTEGMENLTSNTEKLIEIVESLNQMTILFSKKGILNEYYSELLFISCKQFHLYLFDLKHRFDNKSHKKLINRFLEYFYDNFYQEIGFIKSIETNIKRRNIEIGDKLLPKIKEREYLGVWSKWRNIENYMIDPYTFPRENEYNPLMTDYIISFLREIDDVRNGIIRKEVWWERWKKQCEKFAAVLKSSSYTGNVFVIKEKSENDYINQLLIQCYDYFRSVYDKVIFHENDIKSRIDFFKFFTAHGTNYSVFSGHEKAKIESEESISLRGEYYRTKLNLGIVNSWQKIKNSNGRLSEYFEYKNIKSINIYGMGHLGERLAEELINEGFDLRYGIDRNSSDFKKIKVIKPEEDFGEAQAIVVTPIHIFNDIKFDLERMSDKKIISLEEMIEFFLEIEENTE